MENSLPGMLVFIDESGDPGLKLDQGSSAYFVVTLVYFEDLTEANRADARISELRRELGFPEEFEFHFNKLNNHFRTEFLTRVRGFEFFYLAIVLNKSGLYGEGFKFKDSFYKYTCGLVFENAKPYLNDAIVVIDGSGSKEFRLQLERYLKARINEKSVCRHIAKVKLQDSNKNNLLQLADMICGAVARSYKENRVGPNFRRMISHREMDVQVWPKK